MRRQPTLRDRIAARIVASGEDVFLPREFRDLGGEDQVLRALRALVGDGKLIRLGYGVYGRAEISPLTGQPMLAGDGFLAMARHALDKLGVAWDLTEFQRAYNEGRSTQVPINPAVRVKSRFSRNLRYWDRDLLVER